MVDEFLVMTNRQYRVRMMGEARMVARFMPWYKRPLYKLVCWIKLQLEKE